jgi:hypothetical protein
VVLLSREQRAAGDAADAAGLKRDCADFAQLPCALFGWLQLRPKMQALWNRDRLKFDSQQDFQAAVEEGVQEQFNKIVNPEVSRHKF